MITNLIIKFKFKKSLLNLLNRLRWIYCHQFILNPKQHEIKSIVKLTWESFNPSRSASFFLSGLLMYFCIWNRFSKPFLCESKMRAHKRKQMNSVNFDCYNFVFVVTFWNYDKLKMFLTWKHSPSHHASTRLSSCWMRPWESLSCNTELE